MKSYVRTSHFVVAAMLLVALPGCGGGGGGGQQSAVTAPQDGGSPGCTTAHYSPGAVSQPTATELSSFAKAYNGHTGTFTAGAFTSDGGAADFVLGADGTLTYNGQAQTVNSICKDNALGMLYVEFGGTGAVDLLADGSFTGNLPSGGGVHSTVPAATVPTVSGFAPSSGVVGTTLVISGTNLGAFTPAPEVKFGSTVATVSSATATAITVNVPAGLAAGPVAITLSNFDGTGVVAVGTFTVTTSGGGLPAGLQGGSIQSAALSLSGTTTVLVGSGSIGSTDASGTSASMGFPTGITTDGTRLYVADLLWSKVRSVVISTATMGTVAGKGSAGSGDGTGTAAGFSSPKGITTDGTNLYVADTQNGKIRKIVIASGVVSTLAGGGAGTATDGVGAAASFSMPSGITTDGTSLYVADTNNNKIRKVDIATGAVTTLAGSGTMGHADATGVSATFNQPVGVATDGVNLYVADTANHLIRKVVLSTGVVTTLAGAVANTGPLAGADGTGTAARFNFPYGLCSDGHNLYVADSGYNAIRKIVLSTGVVSTLSTGFNVPFGVTTDGSRLFVSDYNGSVVKQVQ